MKSPTMEFFRSVFSYGGSEKTPHLDIFRKLEIMTFYVHSSKTFEI